MTAPDVTQVDEQTDELVLLHQRIARQIERETVFKLSFAKARRRTPDNWQQFAPSVIRLVDDE
jgi:hypothetical protein